MGDPFFLGWPLLAVETRVVGGPSVTYPVLIGLTLAVSRARPFPATQSRGTLDRLESDRAVAPLANGRGGESCLEGLAGGRQLNHWAWIWVGLGRARFSWVKGPGGG